MPNRPDPHDALKRAGTAGLTGEQLANAQRVAEELVGGDQAPGTPPPPES